MAGKGTTNANLTTTFKKGDKVREIKFGGTYTVLFQRGSLVVFVEELSNSWIHPGNLRLISRQAEDAEVCGR